ncbi:putative calmodulin-dependent protein kinase type 1 [Microstroma glucosiphilum]|uniref:Putative calmodulin-dependent protein kinase type 1 n=1 Tax=Pseudomicrostroma glucosiphilum TaxID=1684307 RepID=A0A316TY20_9BASI|nr:putative calmodulin-dependent protein kinase type 1 [Pseudomicrostroma glucosiphilum]PWN17990.1 putative calmodulin-dependent protein kinase type 1 [Pseudomicrostroma glucosiphilum]
MSSEKSAQTVPCAYKTGRTLGQGTYAVVKEAVHIKTGKYYACKVISKKLMEGREHMVRNEISALKRVSQGHGSIVTLVDYFETMNNLYLVTDLCVGGELFDRICERGSYYEQDAAHIVQTVVKAVKYLHDQGIVHRDLKPENLLFRDKTEESDLLIADFGLSRVVDDDTLSVLSTTCGTPGYMAPEIFKKSGHGKPVDMWAIGVISYFLLAGYTPFDRDSTAQEMQAIVNGDYAFEPEVYWQGVSPSARDFINKLLTVDPSKRMTASEALEHQWLSTDAAKQEGEQKDLLPGIRSAFNAKMTFRKAVHGIRLINRLRTESSEQVPRHEVEALRKGIAEAEAENVQEVLDVDLPDASGHQDKDKKEEKEGGGAKKEEGDEKMQEGSS